jgi:serine/threonine-protein kinase
MRDSARPPDAEHPTIPLGTSETLPAFFESARGAIDAEPAALAGTRYTPRKLLGAGGMGEVHLCQDAFLGREVAMKVMKVRVSDGTEGHTRFLREARLQGQLEHPSIVPVYDLAANADGQPYFTMKRIGGKTLRDALDELIDAGVKPSWQPRGEELSQRKLVALLSQASQAVAFAHARGVVHRDLKPENIMLGEFGEVYVLDWGVAKLGAESAEPVEAVASDMAHATQAGALIGTPGYMSPEQVRGEVGEVGPASDVYALGCILFEILTGAMAHEGATAQSLLLSTLANPVAQPLARFPQLEVPPELDAICRRATAASSKERFNSAREFSRQLEEFLDGERDAELRKRSAEEHLVNATKLLTAVAEGGGSEQRERGMQALGRALALDPTNEKALRLVSELVFSDSNALPPEALQELKQVALADRRENSKFAVAGYAVWLFIMMFFLFWGTKNTALTLAAVLGVSSLFVYGGWMFATGNVQPRFMRIAIVANFTLLGMTSAFAGPLIAIPGWAAVLAASFLVSLRATRETKWLLLGLSVASVVVPMLLALTGVTHNPYSFQQGALIVRSELLEFDPPIATLLVMTLVTAAQPFAIFVLVGKATDKLVEAERRNHAMAFRLRQLLPAAPKAS